MLTGDVNEGIPRSASYPSMVSIPDGSTELESSRPRTIAEMPAVDPHDRAHRTVSDPVTHFASANPREESVQQQHRSVERNKSPTTPTDTMSAPITREQLSEATHQARPRSLADVQTIECLYSIEEVSTPGSEPYEGASGGEFNVNRPTHLKLAIPEHQTREEQNNCETSTQTSPPSASIQVQNGSAVQLESSQLDSPVITVTTTRQSSDTDQESSTLGHRDLSVNISDTSSLDNSAVPNDTEQRAGRSPQQSPQSRRRALSDVQLELEIKEEVERLRKRTISSGNTAQDENVQCESDDASNTMQNTTLVASNEGNVTVQSNLGPGATNSPRPQEGARQKVPTHRPAAGRAASSKSSAGQRNNNNSLAQPGGSRAAGETRAEQAGTGDHGMDQQPPDSVTAVSISENTEEVTASANEGEERQTLGQDHGATVSGSTAEGTPGQTAGDGRDVRHAENGSRRDDAVWQRRRRVRSAAPSLRGMVV